MGLELDMRIVYETIKVRWPHSVHVYTSDCVEARGTCHRNVLSVHADAGVLLPAGMVG